MGLKAFDRKFGVDRIRETPAEPGVYLFRDESDEVVYVGKAKDLRARLSQYRNPTRRKIHRKRREIVRAAARLEIRVQPSEQAALLLENELIRSLRPRFNVDGAFDFLYPAIGTGGRGRQCWLCLTTDPDLFEDLDLTWHGVYRPRLAAREAFDELALLLSEIGHPEPRSALPAVPRPRGTRFLGFRRIPAPIRGALPSFLDGESDALLALLFEALLELPDARSHAAEVQQTLRNLRAFHQQDARRLRDARVAVGRSETFVPQAERDALFIEARGAQVT